MSSGEHDLEPTRRGAALAERCVSVYLAGGLYGIPIRHVREIIDARPLTRVFRAHPALAGVTSLRGDILPIIDAALLLGLREPGEGRAAGADARIVVVRETDGARRRAGLIVDSLGPVRDLPRGLDALDAAPPTVGVRTRAVLLGVITEAPLCAVLAVTLLLDAPELAPLAGRAP